MKKPFRRLNLRTYEMYCLNRSCGKDFQAARPHAKYCSPACRLSAWAAKHGR